MNIDHFPRANRLPWSVPAENAIRDAVAEVEKLGAHPELTEAVILLGDAQRLVASYVDKKLKQAVAEKYQDKPHE